MAGITLHYRTSGDLGAGLSRLIAAGEDLSPVMLRCMAIMHDATMGRFEDEVDPLGLPWKKSQRAMEEGGKTLQMRGRLLKAIMAKHDARSARVGVRPDPGLPDDRRGKAPPVMDYAAIHQFGGTIRAKNGKALKFMNMLRASVVMPRRAYLGFSTGEISAIDAALGAHVTSAWSGAGAAGSARP